MTRSAGEHLLAHRHRRRRDLGDPVVVAPEAHPQLVEVGVEEGDVGAHPEGDVGRVLPGDAGPEDHDLGVGHAADAAHEHPAPALGPHHRVRTDLRGEAAGDLGHRVEQRQQPGRQLHRLVGDGGDALRDELLGEGLVGGEVEVGEEEQALAQPVVLLGDGLLDLHHHVGLAPHVVGGVEDAGALRDVLLVGDRRAEAGPLLDEDLVASPDQLVDADRGDADPELVVLDLGGDTDLHGCPTLSRVVARGVVAAEPPPAGARWKSSGDPPPPPTQGVPREALQRRHPATPRAGRRRRRHRGLGGALGADRDAGPRDHPASSPSRAAGWPTRARASAAR